MPGQLSHKVRMLEGNFNQFIWFYTASSEAQTQTVAPWGAGMTAADVSDEYTLQLTDEYPAYILTAHVVLTPYNSGIGGYLLRVYQFSNPEADYETNGGNNAYWSERINASGVIPAGGITESIIVKPGFFRLIAAGGGAPFTADLFMLYSVIPVTAETLDNIDI